jgi:hypothetical protein
LQLLYFSYIDLPEQVTKCWCGIPDGTEEQLMEMENQW